jgi:hypothetical protein
MDFLMQNAVVEAAKAATAAPTELSTAGGAFMAASIGFVLVLTGWCFYRVLTVPHPEDEAAPPPGFGA